mmetsp:Transcript_17667/g.19822  ORF Transcript_17667/g.19822 Transcript_17667/m.19822 type:complete len:88 (-) Transcript_17667:2-265(-)
MIHPIRLCVLLFRIDLYDSQMMILSVRLWNWEGSSFTPITLHEQIMVSFRCDTDSSNREGFATAYASAIFDYIPGPSAAIDYELGWL